MFNNFSPTNVIKPEKRNGLLRVKVTEITLREKERGRRCERGGRGEERRGERR